MRIHHKTRLAAALGAVLAGAAAAPSVQAVNLATDGIGEVATAPYYTVRDGWNTLINLTNTRPVPILVKVRLHEGLNSRDVLDFTVAMSANDVFTAILYDTASGPVLNVQDADSCVIASNNPKTLSVLGYTGTDDRGHSNDDGGPNGVDRMREGYIEFIEMGYGLEASDWDAIQGKPLVYTAMPASPTAGDYLLHVGQAIEDHQCAVLQTALDKDHINQTAPQFGEPINALKFNARLLNAAAGMEVASLVTAWANFFNVTGVPFGGFPFADIADPVNLATAMNPACTITRGDERHTPRVDWDPMIAGFCPNLVTAQAPYDYLEPSLNDAYPRNACGWEDTLNWGGCVSPFLPSKNPLGAFPRGVDALSLTIQRADAINEWSLNDATGTDTSWILTFPTKAFYVDQGAGRQFAISPADGTGDRPEAVYLDPLAEVNYAPFAEPFNDNDTGESCIDVSFTVFDRAENSPLGTGVIDSPAQNAPVQQLCREANVLNFAKSGTGSGVLGSANAITVNVSGVPGNAGWVDVNLAQDDWAHSGTDPDGAGGPWTTGGLQFNGGSQFGPGSVDGALSGLPTIGFMIKHRDLGTPSTNYASTVDHSWRRGGAIYPTVTTTPPTP
jgi:hypothetical protein